MGDAPQRQRAPPPLRLIIVLGPPRDSAKRKATRRSPPTPSSPRLHRSMGQPRAGRPPMHLISACTHAPFFPSPPRVGSCKKADMLPRRRPHDGGSGVCRRGPTGVLAACMFLAGSSIQHACPCTGTFGLGSRSGGKLGKKGGQVSCQHCRARTEARGQFCGAAFASHLTSRLSPALLFVLGCRLAGDARRRIACHLPFAIAMHAPPGEGDTNAHFEILCPCCMDQAYSSTPAACIARFF